MAQLIGAGYGVVGGAVTQVNTTKLAPLGARSFDESGNEYVYLQGVANTTANSWVSYPSGTFITVLHVAAAKGKVAIAMAAVLASQFGWYMIYGLGTGKVTTGGAGAKVWATATPGTVDNTDVATDLIAGVIQVGATAANLATFDLNYPMALAEVYN